MEVCGGHTHTIYRHGIEHVLPANVELVHGPGCPVCVIPMGRVDDAIAVAETPGVIFTSFGDMMRVPGGNGNLLEAKARGADVRFVYSPLDALRIAVENPDREVVFFAVGFETTAPSTAVTLLQARDRRRDATSACSATTSRSCRRSRPSSSRPTCASTASSAPATCRPSSATARTASCPSSTASRSSRPASSRSTSSRPSRCCSLQIREGRCEVENQYTRVVRDEGNPRALRVLAEVFELRPHFEWRGLGFISQSALEAAPRVRARGTPSCATRCPGVRVADPKACQCGEVLKGVIKPWECKVFGTACTPETPDRHLHGVVGRRLRGVLQLRPPAPRGGGHARPHSRPRGYRLTSGTASLRPRFGGGLRLGRLRLSRARSWQILYVSAAAASGTTSSAIRSVQVTGTIETFRPCRDEILGAGDEQDDVEGEHGHAERGGQRSIPRSVQQVVLGSIARESFVDAPATRTAPRT